MNKLRFYLALLLVVTLNGCLVSSLNPLVKEKKTALLHNLDCTWTDKSNNEDWHINLDSNYYDVMVAEFSNDSARKEQPLCTSLVLLFETNGKFNFYDIYPSDPACDNGSGKKGGNYDYLRVRTHAFGTYKYDNDTLTLTTLNFEWIKERAKSKKLKLKHELYGQDDVLITASTKELQDFVRRHYNDTAVFVPFRKFVRLVCK